MLCDLGRGRSAVGAGARSATSSRTGLASPVALRAAVEVHARRGRHGVPAFRDALDDWVLDGKPADSVLEPAMHRLLADHGLPPARFHAVICGYEVDFWIIDSPDRAGVRRVGDATVATGSSSSVDRVRDGVLAAAGYVTVRFTYRQMHAGQPPSASAGRAPMGARCSARLGTADLDLGGIVPDSGTDPARIHPAQMADAAGRVSCGRCSRR